MSRFKGICFAIEDNTEEVPPTEVPAEELDLAPEVVEQVEEVQQDGEVAGEMVEAADSASEDLDTLEEIQDVLEDSVEAGEGVDQPAAAIAEIAVESLCRRLGMKKVTFLPAMESFGSKNSRVSATRIAVEGIVETVKAGWAKLVEWLKKTWATIVAFFKKLFDANLRLEKAAGEMLGKVKALADDAKPKAGEFESKGIASMLGKKSAVEALEGLVALTGKSTEIFNDGVKMVKALEEHVQKMQVGDKVAGTAEVSSLVNEAFVSAMASLPGAEKLKSDGKKGVVIQLAGYKMGFESDPSGEGFNLNLVWEKVEKQDIKVKVLSKDDMVKVVEQVQALSKATAEYKEVYGKMEQINKISLDTVEKVLKNLEKLTKAADASKENQGALVKSRKQLTKANSVLSSLGAKLPSANISAGKTGLEYVAQSLKQYK